MSHSITIDATQHDVSSVCVFQSNRAEVRRIVEVELQSGQNEVIIDRLPNCLDKDSIRVDGIGNAIIFDVIYSPPSTAVDPSTTNLDQKRALKELRTKQALLRSEGRIADQQAKTLDLYANSLTADKANIEALGSFLNMYSNEKAAIHEKVTKGADEIEELAKQIRELEVQMYLDMSGKKRAVKVTVVVLAEVEGKAELLLSYVVSGASWTPLYDLRAKVSNNAKESTNVSVNYRASISQQTGEDWECVDLTLSTASPLVGSEIPTPRRHVIGIPRPVASSGRGLRDGVTRELSYSPRSPGYSPTSPTFSPESPKLPPTSPFAATPVQCPPWRVHTATAVEGAVSTTFVIEGKSTVPSDSDAGSQTHKVSIAIIDLRATLEWITIPKEKPVTFLQCQVKNVSPYVLLPGASNVFMDDNFVCKSTIPSVSPQESFSVSLGVDASVKVTYHPRQKKTKSSTGSLLGPKSDVTSFTQNITVKNTRGARVGRLIVKEMIPVSEDSSVKVTLVEPRDLGLAKERKEVVISRQARARWSFKGGENDGDDTSSVTGIVATKNSSPSAGAGTVEEEGVLEWICELDGGKSVDLVMVYEVSCPVGQRWVTL